MEGGQVAEYDHPATLLTNPDSKFSRLVADTGKSMARHLTKTAVSRTAVMLLDGSSHPPDSEDEQLTYTQAERKGSDLRKQKQRVPEPQV